MRPRGSQTPPCITFLSPRSSHLSLRGMDSRQSVNHEEYHYWKQAAHLLIMHSSWSCCSVAIYRAHKFTSQNESCDWRLASATERQAAWPHLNSKHGSSLWPAVRQPVTLSCTSECPPCQTVRANESTIATAHAVRASVTAIQRSWYDDIPQPFYKNILIIIH